MAGKVNLEGIGDAKRFKSDLPRMGVRGIERMKSKVTERFEQEFGSPSRDRKKVKAWDIASDLGVVVQLDQPNRENAAYIWLPHPGDGRLVPGIAKEYPGESGRNGRHSGTFASPGLEPGKPVLKLTIRDEQELSNTIEYIHALRTNLPLPKFTRRDDAQQAAVPISVDIASMPNVEKVRPKREAIPRAVQREVWQRDTGRCVECSTREKLCFDHIVPFSRGGSNTIRNIQLLCEACNLAKGNRI